MTEERTESGLQAESGAEMERIRDIIFGTQMQDYEQRFESVQRDCDRMQKELDRLSRELAEQAADSSKKVESLRGEMRQADDEVRDELRQTVQRLTRDKVDRAALGKLFAEIGTILESGGSLGALLKELGEGE